MHTWSGWLPPGKKLTRKFSGNMEERNTFQRVTKTFPSPFTIISLTHYTWLFLLHKPLCTHSTFWSTSLQSSPSGYWTWGHPASAEAPHSTRWLYILCCQLWQHKTDLIWSCGGDVVCEGIAFLRQAWTLSPSSLLTNFDVNLFWWHSIGIYSHSDFLRCKHKHQKHLIHHIPCIQLCLFGNWFFK